MQVIIGLVQMAMSDSYDENVRKALKLTQEAATKGAQVICLPELFTGPYFCQEETCDAAKYSETTDSPTIEKFRELAKRHKCVIITGSIYEKEKDKFYNTAVVIDADGTSLGNYRKVHIPHDPSYFEQNYFKPGNLGFKVFNTRYGKIAPLICYDQWFPEAARVVALMGAEMIFYPTAIGRVQGVEEVEGNWQQAWEAVQRGHAVANAVVVAGVNRVGHEGSMVFWGGSFVYDQFGTLKAHGSEREGVIITTVDLGLQKQVREGWRFFYERKPEAYGKITEKT